MRLVADLADMSLHSGHIEDRVLHDQELPVQLVYATRDRENRTASLTVKVKSCTDPGQKTSSFVVEIVDGHDPLFLYTVSISESEFHNLKNDQNLIIDYSQFHIHFIDILQRVKDPSLRYAARLVFPKTAQEMTEFAIYETSEFRRMDQIRLNAVAATDNILKKYLSSNIKALKTKCSVLQSERDEYQCALSKTESELHQLQKDYESSLKSFESQKSSMALQFSEKLSAAKEEAGRLQRKVEIQFDEDKKSLESDYKQQLASITSKLESSQKQNQELLQANLNLNHSVESLDSKLKAQAKDLEHSLAEQTRLRSLKESLDSQVLTLEKDIGRLSSRVAFLEQQLTDKEALCEKVQSLLDASNEQKAHLEQSITLFKETAQKDDRRLNECMREIKKGTQIIQTLQNDLKSAKSKLKLTGTVVIQQEAVLEKSKKENESLNLTISELRSDNKKLQSELKNKEDEILQLNKELGKSKEVITQNQGVIGMLGNQLKEAESSRIPSMLPTRSSIYKSNLTSTPPSLHKSIDGMNLFSPQPTLQSRLEYNSSSVTTPIRSATTPIRSYPANPTSSAFFPSAAPSAPIPR